MPSGPEISMAATFDRKLPFLLLFVFIVLTAVGFVFYRNASSMQGALEFEKRSTEVFADLDSINTSLMAIDNGMKGFVITGNPTYLDSLGSLRQNIAASLANLRRLKLNNFEQIERYNELERMIARANAEVDKKIELRRQKGFDEAIGEISNQQDIALSNQIRQSIETAKSAEMQEMDVRNDELSARFKRTIWILILGSLAGIASLVVTDIILYLEVRRRKKAEVSILETNKDLEKRIDERTKQLKEINENLIDLDNQRRLLLLNEQHARQEAEIANRLRDEFMATVSHELKTPLNSILGWSRLLQGSRLNPDQTNKAVETIIKNAETQNLLIEDLLDVAKVVSGKMELDLAPIHVADVVRHGAESIGPSAQAKHQEITINIDEEAESRYVLGDANRLRQIVANLLTNAVKFTPENGHIDIGLAADDGDVKITVADDGDGIDPEFLPLIFERFRQDLAKAGKNGGLGLGLSIVRNLTEMHGGTVKAESDGDGKGAKFTITLPVVGES
jgi:signal transduction histidine kinase